MACKVPALDRSVKDAAVAHEAVLIQTRLDIMDLMWELLSQVAVVGGYVLLLLVNAAGVVLVALQLPGTWLILLATVAVAWSRPGGISNWVLLVLAALAILGEVVEFVASAAGAARAGASRRGAGLAIVGSVIGAILGTVAIPIFIVGTLIGAGVGAGVGSVVGDLWTGRRWHSALRGGGGAAVGRFTGSVAKLVIAVAMWSITAVALIWP